MRAGSKGEREAGLKAQEQRKIVRLRIGPSRSGSRQIRDLAQEPARHVEKVNRRFIEIAARDCRIFHPGRRLKFSPVHLELRKRRLVSPSGQKLFHEHVCGGKPPIVPDSEN